MRMKTHHKPDDRSCDPVRVHLHPLSMNNKSMNTTTTTNLILPSVRKRPANRPSHPQGFHDVATLNPTGWGEIETSRGANAKL